MNSQLLSGQRVLVVEDEMLVLMAIEDMLTDLGCTSIAVAGTVDTALGLIASQQFDLATLDLNLNGQRSYPIAQALTERNVPFVFSTGYGAEGVRAEFGGRPVLNKPFDGSQLIAILTTLLAPTEPPSLAS